ncbi:MAG: hypothetical protein MI743_01060 [Sneathiellales bacterium]|nr:hypothetical protein [Sneathiellales bacterium]
MHHKPPALELIMLCTETLFPVEFLPKIKSILAMYGYTLLKHQEIAVKQDPNSLKMEKFPYQLALITQNIHSNVQEENGVKFNTNILRAVRGISKKVKMKGLRLAVPNSQENHEKCIQNMQIEDFDVICKVAKENIEEFHPPFPVISSISNANSRTRVDKVMYKGQVAVCKTFRTTNTDALVKEVSARKALATKIPEVSSIIEHGDNYFVMPFYESVWTWKEGTLSLFPQKYAEICIDIVKRVNAEKWALIDWHPGNFIYGQDDSVILIDLEAATEQDQLMSFEACFDILGHPNFPYQGKSINYVNTWQPITGLSLKRLLYAASWEKKVVRGLYFVSKKLPKWFAKTCEQKLRKLSRKYIKRSKIDTCGRYIIIKS